MTSLNMLLSQQWIYALGWTLLHSLWQGALIAAVLALVLYKGKHWQASSRYLVCTSALTLLLFSSIATFAHYYSALGKLLHTEHSVSHSLANQDNLLMSIQYFFNQHMMLIVSAWLVGFTLFFIHHCMAWVYGLRLKQQLSIPASSHWQKRLAQLAEHVEVRAAVTLKLCRKIQVPCVIGHIKPVILLPASLLTQLSTDEIEAILLHELGHIRRHDYLIGLCQSLIKTLYFFNLPALWISAQMDREREHACDDIAVENCKDRLFYAKTLQRFSNINQQGGLAMAANGNPYHLLARVQRLFDTSFTQNRSLEGVVSSLLMFIAVIFLSIQAHKSEATETYPEIQTLSDTQVQQLIDSYRLHVTPVNDTVRFITHIEKDPALLDLNEQEQQAFANYFSDALWQERSNDKKWDIVSHLDDEAWNKLNYSMHLQRYGHIIEFLKSPVDHLQPQQIILSEQNIPVMVNFFDHSRLEMSIPIELIQKAYQQEAPLTHEKLAISRTDEDGLQVIYAITPVSTNQITELVQANNSVFNLHTGVSNGHDQPTVFFRASDSFYKIEIPKEIVSSIIDATPFSLGNVYSGVQLVHNHVDIALEPETSEEMTRIVVESQPRQDPKILGDKRVNLQEKINQLPAGYDRFLYTEATLERAFLGIGFYNEAPMNTISKEHMAIALQEMVVDDLLQRDTPPEHQSEVIAPFYLINHNIWVTILSPEINPALAFDLELVAMPFNQALSLSEEHCAHTYPENFASLTHEISIYGFDLNCEAVNTIFTTLAEESESIDS